MDAMMKTKKLICPLCKEKLNYIEARQDNSGGLWLPYVSCECGFSFSPKPKLEWEMGENGWKIDSRKIKIVNDLIAQRFGPVQPNQ